MAFIRVEITARTVKEALAAAAERRQGTNIWADTKLPYLIIRQRAGAAKWTVKAMKTMRVIGDTRERHPEYLSVTDARKAATNTYTELRYGDAETPASADEAPAGWTWADLDREYQAMIAQPRWVNRRMKPPSAGTCNDVRLAFARPSFTALHDKPLTELDRPQIHAARDAIESHRQREKNVAYFKAAMTWAADKKPDESGLIEGADRWWERLTAGDPDTETMHAIEARRAVHRQHKADLDVKAIGAVLARHEAYCRGRTAEDKISPGIRWGLWWVCLTANRRASTVQLRRKDFMAQDPLGEDGWGRAAWPPAAMKAKTAFWLPLPSVVRDVAAGSIKDYTQLVANEHGDWPSAWVFASTRRYGRDADNDDVSVYPNSLNRHIQRMRDADALDGLPHFGLHLVRSAMGDHIAEKVSGVVSSLVLAHTLPQDEGEAAPTTRQYYLTSQRMAEKTTGMRAWSEALIEAYLAAGGTMPVPSEERRRSKLKANPRL
ncbi:hypothetical protein M2171_002611 [Bradyrhizobium japonicum USDA 38]|uniref:hypothetical protein n=1 Tax=Bradyrhizobium japonicum TaxID=375 RepID=UPI00041F2A36|nr:hypothetical protein [Bradyrhizobium japonicum]MCS3893478.1 hypothetical protein [Bradyrhizobium japonicum USDA 38]MCS3945992.1 hypothetical protein [Bradyrhizobium japonicum]